MIAFNKEKFRWDGMYLMYEGDLGVHGVYYFSNMAGGCHPTRHATQADLFIARFKYGRKNWKTWVNFIVKNFTVDRWVEMQNAGVTPVDAMLTAGFDKL
jgi:hypothetical protein